ncbi:MAG: hypothetical protein AB8C84_11525 [Oligoflexales bacterium]
MKIIDFYVFFCLVFFSCKSREREVSFEKKHDFSDVYMVDSTFPWDLSKLINVGVINFKDVQSWVVWNDNSRKEKILLAELRSSSTFKLSLTGQKRISSEKVSSSLKYSTHDAKISSNTSSQSKAKVVVDFKSREISQKIENYLKPYENVFAVEDSVTQGGKGYLKNHLSSDVELTRILAAFSLDSTKDFGFDVVSSYQLGGLQDIQQQGTLSVKSILQRMEEKENYSVIVQLPERLHWVGLHKSKDEVVVFDSVGSSSKTLEVGYGVKISQGRLSEAIEVARVTSLEGRDVNQVHFDGVSQEQMSILIRQWNFKHMLGEVSRGRRVLWVEKPHQTEDGWRCGYHQLEAAYRNSHGKSLDLNKESQDQRFLNEFLGVNGQYEKLAVAVEILRTDPINQVLESEIDSTPTAPLSEEVWKRFGENITLKKSRSSFGKSWLSGLSFFAVMLGGGVGFYAMTDSWFKISNKPKIIDEDYDGARSLPPNLVLIKKEQGQLIGYQGQQFLVDVKGEFVGSLVY